MRCANGRFLGPIVALLTLVACSGGGDDPPAGDRTPPTVTSTSPAPGAVGVAASPTISATFSEAVDAASVTAATFTLSGGVTGTVAVSGSVATFTPSAPLASTTSYTATLTTGVKDLAGNPLAASHAWSFTTGDFVPPTVVSTSPAANATDVALGADVTVTFSEPIAASSVTTTSFTVGYGTTGAVVGLVSASGTTATFAPTTNLASGMTYEVTIEGVTDLAGNPMGAPYTFSFTTLDNVVPAIVGVSPAADATQVPTDAKVVVTFSEPVDPATVTAGSFSIPGVLGSILVDGATATLTPAAPLDPDAGFTATVTTGIKDLAGNALAAPYSWTFHTVDTRPPTIVSRSPAANATGVALGDPIVVTFSEPVDPATVTTSSFTLSGVTGTVSVDGDTATFTPAASLAGSTSYTVTLSTAITDLYGNALAAPALWTFRTLDTVPPTVVSTTPASGATGVQTNVTIVATFSEDVLPSSVTSSTFTVASGATSVTGTIHVAGSEVSFVPASALLPSTPYTVTFTTGVTDLAGNALASAYSWTFTTVANIAPVSNAGADQNASFGQLVTLDGTLSRDPDGATLTYRWTQSGGTMVALGGAATASATFTAPSDVGTLSFQLLVTDANGATSSDAVTVRVWVDRTRVVLVSTTGVDSNTGGFGAPMRTLAAGITRATGYGTGGAVYAAAGTYTQASALNVTSGIGVYGGFNPTTWDRSVVGYPTVVNGFPLGFVIQATGAKLNGLTINPANATTGSGSSIGVLVRNSQTIEIAGCTIRAGLGAAGLSGVSGSSGARGANGGSGGGGSCDNAAGWGLGGAGGTGAYTGGAGGRGGAAATGYAGSTGGGGALGGSGGGSSGSWGGVGQDGAGGSTGSVGAGGAPFGLISPLTGYTVATGGSGGAGNPGRAGGGGGGGAGQWGLFVDDGGGNGGGGGGGGSYGGTGGFSGNGGGGSFGIIVYASTGVAMRDVTVQSQAGGAGGAGGSGGYGGSTTSGGPGGTVCTGEVGGGGRGGYGGYGGTGGRGGGGGGGPSIAILEDLASVTTRVGVVSSNGTPGMGGAPNGAAGLSGPYVKR